MKASKEIMIAAITTAACFILFSAIGVFVTSSVEEFMVGKAHGGDRLIVSLSAIAAGVVQAIARAIIRDLL